MAQTGVESTYMDFPDDWKLEESSGVGPFTTRTVHRRPDGSKYEWEARKHRRRGGGPSSGGKSRWLRFFAPGNLTWWVGVTFVLGSLLFTVAASVSLFPGIVGLGLAFSVVDWSYFVGATLFTVGVYLELLETINSSSRPQRKRRSASQRFRWFAWQPKSLGYVSALVMLVGAVAFNVETFFAIPEWYTLEPVNWLTTVPAILGAILFVVSTYMGFTEICHRYLCAKPRNISWWSSVCNTVGSVGFVIGAVAGFTVPGLSTPASGLIVTLSFLVGSVLFLIGSYLMFPEMFSE